MTRTHVAKHTTIATANVKIAFVAGAPAETHPVHLMLLLRMIDNNQRRFAPWVGHVRVSGDKKFRNMAYARAKRSAGRGVGHVKASVACIRRIERQAQQSLFATQRYFRRDIEKGRWVHGSGR